MSKLILRVYSNVNLSPYSKVNLGLGPVYHNMKPHYIEQFKETRSVLSHLLYKFTPW